MKPDETLSLNELLAPTKALHEVLDQSEQAKALVEECAEDLSEVNTDIKQGLAVGNDPPDIEKVLEKSELIENKVQEASDQLADVNLALAAEVHERHVLEENLVAVTEEKDKVSYAALHDSLTGLANRTLFDDRLVHALAMAKRHGQSVAVMFVDLDGFKSVNDTHGHAAGDSVLKTIASRLSISTREEDSISRFGGDEFVLLLLEAGDKDEVARIAEKILRSINTPCEVSVGDELLTLQVRASLGIAIFPTDGDTAEAMIASADKAMYEAKKQKSGYMFATA